MQNLAQIKYAPLYMVAVGLTSSKKLSMRVFPLTKAFEKGKEWFYPSGEGRQSIKNSALGSIMEHLTPGGKKGFKAYCNKSSLKSVYEKLEKMFPKAKTQAVVPATKLKNTKIKVEPGKSLPKAKPVASKIAGEKRELITETGFHIVGKNLEDVLAVEAYLRGDKEKFAVLYTRYHDIILRSYQKSFYFKQNELAEDLTMELFEKLLSKLDTYSTKYTFSAWIGMCAKNYLIDYFRKQKMNTISISQSFGDSEEESGATLEMFLSDDGSNCPEGILLQSQAKEALRKAFEYLDKQSVRIMVAKFFNETRYDVIAKQEKVNVQYVKTCIFRSKKKLRAIFEKHPSLLSTIMVMV
jgi:RNA polymerase sigma-70 factor (ECF subfamily)